MGSSGLIGAGVMVSVVGVLVSTWFAWRAGRREVLRLREAEMERARRDIERPHLERIKELENLVERLRNQLERTEARLSRRIEELEDELRRRGSVK